MQRILILLFFAMSFYVRSQGQTVTYVDGKESSQTVFADTLQQINFLRDLQLSWLKSGFMFAGVDSVKSKDQVDMIFLHKGDRIQSRIQRSKSGNAFKLIDKELSSFINNGFPFAYVFMDSLNVEGDKLRGTIRVNKGPEIRYDSAKFLSPINTKEVYIYNLLDLSPGEYFRESTYQRIEKQIGRSPFLSLGSPVDVSFRKNGAIVFLDILEQPSNTFQGVLGLQQVNQGRSTLVGTLDLSIENLFRSGKQLQFNWERFSEESQQLKLSYLHPFFLDSRISPSLGLELLKQDTTFITRRTGVGIETFIGSTTNLALEFERISGSLLSTDIEVIRTEDIADFERNSYSIGVSDGLAGSLDALQQDVVWSVGMGAGRKRVNRNLNLPSIFYDTIELESNYYQFDLLTSFQVKWRARQTLFQKVELGGIVNDQPLSNELYRMGGLRSVRGFNEKSIFAQYYALSRLELRSFFEETSYFYLFYDQLIYRRDDIADSPFGIGLGFVLGTSSGRFSFALAGGQSDGQQLSFSELRAHFGYISRF